MRKYFLALAAMLSFTLSARLSDAQSVTAQIIGSVSGPTGSSVPDAEIKAISNSTGVSVTQKSKADGSFQFLNLPVGSYDVTVSKAGFQTSSTRGIVIAIDQVYKLKASLEIGSVSQSVDVQANASQVDTTVTEPPEELHPWSCLSSQLHLPPFH